MAVYLTANVKISIYDKVTANESGFRILRKPLTLFIIWTCITHLRESITIMKFKFQRQKVYIPRRFVKALHDVIKHAICVGRGELLNDIFFYED